LPWQRKIVDLNPIENCKIWNIFAQNQPKKFSKKLQTAKKLNCWAVLGKDWNTCKTFPASRKYFSNIGKIFYSYN
jgi:hypothetical protein